MPSTKFADLVNADKVRVPLNTALLAYQNLDGEGAFVAATPEQRDMISGLSSSLASMEKVLNDVLDFSRMDAGRLTCTSQPFEFHSCFRAMMLTFRPAATSKGLKLEQELDPAIDALFPSLLGDEMRLSQILSNLVSNSCKFTEAGGTVKMTTKLLHPSSTSTPLNKKRASVTSISLVGDLENQVDGKTPIAAADIAIIRIEISDDGVGIRPRDLLENRLFSPYVQTAIGRLQGGKGSGLGLALVKQIVSLSGGRLGVQSAPGKGI